MFEFIAGVVVGAAIWGRFGVHIKTWVTDKWKQHVIDNDPNK